MPSSAGIVGLYKLYKKQCKIKRFVEVYKEDKSILDIVKLSKKNKFDCKTACETACFEIIKLILLCQYIHLFDFHHHSIHSNTDKWMK